MPAFTDLSGNDVVSTVTENQTQNSDPRRSAADNVSHNTVPIIASNNAEHARGSVDAHSYAAAQSGLAFLDGFNNFVREPRMVHGRHDAMHVPTRRV